MDARSAACDRRRGLEARRWGVCKDSLGGRVCIEPGRLLGIEALHVLHRASGDASPRTTPLQIQVDFAQSGSSWQLLDSAAEALGEQPGQGSLIAPMPGKVIAIHAAVGDEVRAGQVLLVIEAMKMEHSLQAEVDGKLLSLNVELGDQVADAALLAQIERTTRA
ncbi:MAG: acetyl-CoA carboxylase biotin carboxyl carrier protein subunit [Betaproteobacteria bacterium]|nr:acetyl-CoA carboxylase biotin carboxyl carrier protein subunit [Betaproteobacteria bacterium]